LAKTHHKLFADIKRIIARAPKLEEDTLEELEAALIASDIGIQMARKVIGDLRRTMSQNRELRDTDVFQIARQLILTSLTDSAAASALLAAATPPTVVVLVGVNGAGKTTCAAKLAHLLKSQGKQVIIGACDTFRAAATDQLKIWAQRAGVDIVAGQHGADAAAVAFDALEAAIARKADYLLIDTAGRLHTKKNLMEELKKMHRSLQKRLPAAPHETLLVLDGSTGQNALTQARQFHAALGLTGLIITKLDGTAKGGIVVAIATDLKIPVKFIGAGEQLDDLHPFDAKAFAEALFAQ
jgi:fused signal recognition particle receptor